MGKLKKEILITLEIKMCQTQGWRNGFQSEGAMEHWKALLATMVGRQGKVLNSGRSRMAKTVIFWQFFQNIEWESKHLKYFKFFQSIKFLNSFFKAYDGKVSTLKKFFKFLKMQIEKGSTLKFLIFCFGRKF